MKQYAVQVDVTMSGTVYVDADNEQQAANIACKQYFVGSDLTNFYWMDTQVVDIEEEQ